ANISRQIGRQRITAGADFEYSPEVSQENFVLKQPPLLDVKRSPWLVAAYGEAELNLVPRLTIRAGARFDWFDTFGGAVSPRIALVYHPSPRTALKYIFARAFRAPNTYENYYYDDISIEPLTKSLGPEQITSHEAVFERSLTAWLMVTADGFYNNLSNLIDE